MALNRRVVLVGLVGALAGVGAALAAARPEDAAQAAAESWLGLVDRADYSASWGQAASGLKGTINQREWDQMVGNIRTPLGKLVSRRLKSREYTEKGPTTRVIGGKVYETVFAKKAAVETVIPVPESDGAWRVSSYSVR
jgi:Protein of unknown function (DUF4019)